MKTATELKSFFDKHQGDYSEQELDRITETIRILPDDDFLGILRSIADGSIGQVGPKPQVMIHLGSHNDLYERVLTLTTKGK